jgi:hypothetical protein
VVSGYPDRWIGADGLDLAHGSNSTMTSAASPVAVKLLELRQARPSGVWGRRSWPGLGELNGGILVARTGLETR